MSDSKLLELTGPIGESNMLETFLGNKTSEKAFNPVTSLLLDCSFASAWESIAWLITWWLTAPIPPIVASPIATFVVADWDNRNFFAQCYSPFL